MRKTIKGLPIAAVLLVAVVFGGKAMMKNAKVFSDENWVYTNAPGCTPLMEDCYERYNDTGSLSDVCEKDAEICGVVAPAQTGSEGNPNKPHFDPILLGQIGDGLAIEGVIFLGPKIVNPSN